MIKRLTVENVAEVNALMRDPEIYPFIIDDSCPAPEEFDATEALENRRIYTAGWYEHDKLVGLWMGIPWSFIMYQVHICISVLYRGRAMVEATEDAIKWMFMSSPCRKMIALVPNNNKRMKMAMKALGFDREGRLKGSYLKDGELIDEVVYGLQKEGGD